ncbi:MAG TPA: ABC transporter ATP-binding protein [Microthrixaceae bacterium]|nr:ABC transporter ATP-binding protein [Microthrixaceae bacterium]
MSGAITTSADPADHKAKSTGKSTAKSTGKTRPGDPSASNDMDVQDDEVEVRAMDVLRAGVRATPELRVGLGVSIAMALVMAGGKMVIPIAIQQILDKGVGGGEPRWGFVLSTASLAAVAMVALAVLNKVTYMRLMVTAENVIYGLRTRAFSHVHRLSLAHHNDSKRGVMVARVTSDIETLAQFASWGAVSWIVNSTVIVVSIAVIAIYSWQLSLITLFVMLPIAPILKVVQKRQLNAYGNLRTRVSDTLSEISETVMGIRVIRAYADAHAARKRLDNSIDQQRDAQLKARFFYAIMFPVSDIFSGLMLGAVIGAGVWWGPSWGLNAGSLIAVVFLANMIVQPVADIGEVLDQTQTALAGWRKVLNLLDEPIDVIEPEPGVTLPSGALALHVANVGFEYEPGSPVLTDVSLRFDAGVNAAIVGETGSGKTTLAKLLTRLADPTSGQIFLDGVDLRDVAHGSRALAIRLVAQDGFLFETTIAENVRFGRPGASDAEVLQAFESLDLLWWLDSMPDGLQTHVGERGDALSVGERQLVALARAQLADPGLLILDEATSAVDPETERALAKALAKLSEGRTTISIAHRLSTAEAADVVIVFDQGRVVQTGHHSELVADGGVYGRLYASWIGNTRSS